jgi:hypothetical protein
MFRRVLAPALLALAALPGLAPAQAVPNPAPAKTVRGTYSLEYRRPGMAFWLFHSTHTDLNKFKEAYKNLDRDGYEIRLKVEETILRPGAAPSLLTPAPKPAFPPAILPKTLFPTPAPKPLFPVTPAKPTFPPVTLTPTPASFRASGKVVSKDEARQVFSIMASRTDIAYRYPADGCYARAHLMIKQMLAMSCQPGKVWAFARSKNEPLFTRTTNHPRGYVTWKYHVAPTLLVRGKPRKNGKPGKARRYVIDPSMFNEPVTVKRWKLAMKRPNSRVSPYITLTKLGEAPRGADGRRYAGSGYFPGADPKPGLDVHAVLVMAKYKPHQGKWELKQGKKAKRVVGKRPAPRSGAARGPRRSGGGAPGAFPAPEAGNPTLPK